MDHHPDMDAQGTAVTAHHFDVNKVHQVAVVVLIYIPVRSTMHIVHTVGFVGLFP